MKAGVLLSVNDVNYTTIADPELEAGDMLLKVKAATVCGTDIRILAWQENQRRPLPFSLGT